MAHVQIAQTTPANPIAGFGARILGFLVSIAEANSRVREADRLQSLSDEELAAKGLRREDIARHVFRDMFYL